MTEYTITVEGYETGLTRTAVRSVAQDLFPNTEVKVEVEESGT